MMPTFYIIIKGGGGKAKIGGTHETRRIERTRGVELFCLDQRATPHVTHTNERTKKKRTKKNDVKMETHKQNDVVKIPFFGQQQFWTLDDDDDERKVRV